jgi:hypothetical protein
MIPIQPTVIDPMTHLILVESVKGVQPQLRLHQNQVEHVNHWPCPP